MKTIKRMLSLKGLLLFLSLGVVLMILAGHLVPSTPKPTVQTSAHSTGKLRDYQLDITEDMCYIYDGDRLVGKCTVNSNLIEKLIEIDNL